MKIITNFLTKNDIFFQENVNLHSREYRANFYTQSGIRNPIPQSSIPCPPNFPIASQILVRSWFQPTGSSLTQT